MKNIFKKNKCHTNSFGFSLVEVLIACALITTTTLSLMSAASKGIELSNKALRQVQQSLIMEEGVEAVKSIRDTNWTNVSGLSGTNYLLFNTTTNTWSLSSGNPVEVIDGIFTRRVDLSSVYRDGNSNIAATGTLDTGAKRVNVIVSWSSPSGTNSKNITFYLTNIFN